MGLFDALGMGMRGLHAAQTAIDVTGQNISNANTEGYSRQKIDQSATSVNNDVFGEVGTGVEVTSILRVRDTFLDHQTWEQLGEKGMVTELDTAFTRLENILREPSPDGLAAQMNKFWSAWQDLANNPSDLAARESVKATGNILADGFHSAYGAIEAYGLSMNNPLTQKALAINDYTRQIYQLNEKIAGVESGTGPKANSTRDERDILIRKLSEMVDVQAIEDMHGRMIITTGGSLLVGSSANMEISTYGVDQVLADGSTTTELRLRFTDSRKNFEPRGGGLRGVMDARSELLAGIKEKLNTLAKGLVTQVNKVHTEGYTLSKTTGVFFFDPAHLKAGDISISDSVNADVGNIAAAQGGKIVEVASFAPLLQIPAAGAPTIDLKAISPAYQNLTQDGVKIVWTNGVILEEGAGKDYIVNYEKGTITFLNYAKYVANDNVDITFKYNTTGFPGNGNGQNAAAVASSRLAKTLSTDQDGLFTQTVGDFYSAIIGKMGVDKNQNSARKETSTFLVAQMDSEQASLAGVSLDEEMTNMIKFENSYKASAKYIQTISQMMEVLMSLG
jgi:flagellar hook-associated protein 1